MFYRASALYLDAFASAYLSRISETEAPAVIINEAMEVGRRFSTDESGPFLNGILDAIRKSIEAAAAKTR